MRIVTDGPVVCECTSGQGSPAVNHWDETAQGQGAGYPVPGHVFPLGLPANASLMLRREGSGLDAEEAALRRLDIHAAPLPPAQTVDPDGNGNGKGNDNIKHTLASLPLTLHGPAAQPSTPALLKTFPSSILTRISSFTTATPLPHRWTFPPTRRYRIKDTAAYAALREKNIEWYVTTGLLIEDQFGLKWAAGDYTYLLFWLDEGLPVPEGVGVGVGVGCRALSLGAEVVREWQVGRWVEHDVGDGEEERPGTPIILDEKDPMEGGGPVVRSFSHPSNPLAAAARPRSALSDPGRSTTGKKVRLHGQKRHRTVELVVDDAGVLVEEHDGKVSERIVDEVAILTDNEGKTMRSWAGIG
ncbi:hypothetical protein GMOD_00005961 [Pyrenophora seminiperda CCB06]|uniref:Uncharacterized protein n=1 Tax=Pyrenophora seminiperda CCB06 TaxID=1302712 RepID=A0A3M7MA99_9PLEO|nr:hypothetical protein GMOD_00005961 [Pyrenophora seminiperda CCB06]